MVFCTIFREVVSVVMDRINGRFGAGGVFLASRWGGKPDWQPKRNMVSPDFLCSYEELPVVRYGNGSVLASLLVVIFLPYTKDYKKARPAKPAPLRGKSQYIATRQIVSLSLYFRCFVKSSQLFVGTG